jgi:hypothetical protein
MSPWRHGATSSRTPPPMSGDWSPQRSLTERGVIDMNTSMLDIWHARIIRQIMTDLVTFLERNTGKTTLFYNNYDFAKLIQETKKYEDQLANHGKVSVRSILDAALNYRHNLYAHASLADLTLNSVMQSSTLAIMIAEIIPHSSSYAENVQTQYEIINCILSGNTRSVQKQANSCHQGDNLRASRQDTFLGEIDEVLKSGMEKFIMYYECKFELGQDNIANTSTVELIRILSRNLKVNCLLSLHIMC